MSDDILQMQVAGTTIMLKESEAALVIYVDDVHRKKEATIETSLDRYRASARFIEHQAGNRFVCAIFPRIPMKGRDSNTCYWEIPHWRDRDFVSGGNNYGTVRCGSITIFGGNVTELDLRGDIV
jgi:hypothetical protein